MVRKGKGNIREQKRRWRERRKQRDSSDQSDIKSFIRWSKMAQCNKCGRHIKAEYAKETGMCYNCYKRFGQHHTQGGTKMGFKHVEHSPRTVDESESIGGRISGRNDVIFYKNKYQTELDNTWSAIVNMVHFLETKTLELKHLHAAIPTLKKNIEAHQAERVELYRSLGNVLTKETDFEDKMWKTTQEGRKVKSVTIKQKFNDSDLDEMKFDSMMEYLKQYPEYASKSSFKKITDKIEQKEGEIRAATEKYNDIVSQYNAKLSEFEILIAKAEDKFVAYEKIKAEAEEIINNCRYHKSLLNVFRTAKDKAEAKLDLLSHRIDQFRRTLDIIKSEHSQSKRKAFVEVEL